MNIIPAASGTIATLVNGERLSVIGWGFILPEDPETEHRYALTIRGAIKLHPDFILDIHHACGRTEEL